MYQEENLLKYDGGGNLDTEVTSRQFITVQTFSRPTGWKPHNIVFDWLPIFYFPVSINFKFGYLFWRKGIWCLLKHGQADIMNVWVIDQFRCYGCGGSF